MPTKIWFVVYRSKHCYNDLETNLAKGTVEYFIPHRLVYNYNKEEERREEIDTIAIHNLAFIRIEPKSLMSFIRETPGIRCTFHDRTTHKPARVPDDEMLRFQLAVQNDINKVKLLRDPFSRFAGKPKVRVEEGEFKGMEGRLVRIMKKRRLVISLGNQALCLVDVDHSLCSVIE